MTTSLKSTSDIVELICELDHRERFPPEEFERVNALAGELTQLPQEDSLYFLLGSFHEGDRDLLEETRERINSQSGTVAYTMDDFSNINAITKFVAIAMMSDQIIQIVERDHGGEIGELGMIAREEELRRRTHLLKRQYEGWEHDYYSWMQSEGFFSMFDDMNRLYEWDNKEELNQHIDSIVNRTS